MIIIEAGANLVPTTAPHRTETIKSGLLNAPRNASPLWDKLQQPLFFVLPQRLNSFGFMVMELLFTQAIAVRWRNVPHQPPFFSSIGTGQPKIS